MEIKTIVGLEIHVQLKTKTKMFCSCEASYFEDKANTHVCPVCLGLPGALPVLNKEALIKAIRVGKVLNFTINNRSRFDRKNYMYPDLFKGYQITQFEFPIDTDGFIDLDNNKRINIFRAHLEEDTAKSLHHEGYTLLDGNKAGIPLLEIVSAPEMYSSKEAKEYAKKVYNLVRFVGASDCDMEKGQMRFDVNVNLEIHKEGKIFKTPIVEIKNLNSFRSLERSIEYEEKRQLEEFEKTGKVLDRGNKSTRGWNDNLSKTYFQREKEESDDYRYFPEPDIPPLNLSDGFISKAIESIDVLPQVAQKKLEEEYLLPHSIVILIMEERKYYDFFQRITTLYKNYINLANWFSTDILSLVNQYNINLSDISTDEIVKILTAVDKKEITVSTGKQILKSVLIDKDDIDILLEKNSLISDQGKLDETVKEVLDKNPDIIEKYLSGKESILSFLIGEVMKILKGRANPLEVKNKILDGISKIKSN